MDRPFPTEPPEEPVNRIAPYLEKMEAQEILGFQGALEDMPTELRELFNKAWEAFLRSPENVEACKALLRSRFQAGEYKQCIMLAEIFQQHVLLPDVEVEELLGWARSKLAEGGG